MKIKKIEEYEGYYVDDEGNVLSTKNSDMKWMKQGTSKNGYKQVVLCKDGKVSMKSVHRLVAEAFIPNPNNKPCIDHINGIREDNRVENLRWCTHKENNNNPITRERNSEAKKGKPNLALSKPIEQWSKDGTILIARYASMHEAEKETGVNQGNISRCCNDKLKTTGGFLWRYA